VSFSLKEGEILGIVGESGSGKSVTALTIMGLLPTPPARIAAGKVLFQGQELTKLSSREMQRIRGPGIAMIFQEPMTSLNPVFSIGDQIMETIKAHENLPAAALRKRAIDMLDKVGIPSAARRLDDYPHQMSGGQRQRVMIAIALACNPKLLIADEPTTALDVTVQAQILALLDDLKRETGAAVILITHDLGVVADHADDVVVMYAGRVAEQARAADLFARPEHPYTVGLLGAAPAAGVRGERLASIEGTVPDLRAPPPGCRFAPRCPFAIARCAEGAPPLTEVAPGHFSACLRAPLDAILGAAA
jgi:oligopeptide/dipeptide ABC transporter ATP-binding protein